MNSICFHFASEFLILTLAQMFNSLVRVSRRVVCQIKQTWHTLLQYKVLCIDYWWYWIRCNQLRVRDVDEMVFIDPS